MPPWSIIAFAWGAAIAVLVWAFVPLIVTALGATRLRIVLTEEPHLSLRPGNPAWEERLLALAQLGFRPVGTLREEAWLFQHHWHWRAPLMVLFSTADRRVFASLYRFPADEQVRIVFETHLTEQGRVETAMPGSGILEPRGNRMRQEFLLVDSVEQLFARHQEQVLRFCEHRGLQAVALTPAERTARDVEYYHRDQSLSTEPILGGLCFLALPALVAVGLIPWGALGVSPGLRLPAAVLLGGFVYLGTVNPLEWLQPAYVADWERET